MMIQYRELCEDEIDRELFRGFIRRQNVTKCWRKQEGEWMIKDDPFIDDWSEKDYQTLIVCLKHTLSEKVFRFILYSCIGGSAGNGHWPDTF